MIVMLEAYQKKSQTLGDTLEYAVLKQMWRKQFHQVTRVVGAVLVYVAMKIVQTLA